MKLFICFTPLHVLISEKIIKKEEITEYLFVYFTDLDSDKNRFYFDKLSINAIESYYILLKKSLFKDIFTLLKLFQKLKKYKELIYYSGKIKSFHNRFLMHLTGYKDYITFDDGSGNISNAGYFYEENENILFKIFFTFFNKKLLYKNIKVSNQLHYTIFDLPNVFQNIKLISLFNKKELTRKNNFPKITILLTNAFAEDREMSLDEEVSLYSKIIDEYNISHIIKHPREKFPKIDNSTIIEIVDIKIAEEKILELLKEYNITVIGIYSTVLLNLMGYDGLKLINIDVSLKKPVKTLRKLLERYGIENKIF